MKWNSTMNNNAGSDNNDEQTQRNNKRSRIDNTNSHSSLKSTAKKKRFQRAELPIDLARDELADAIRNNDICIVVGETGSGKSTQIPQICYEESLSGAGLIAITQPRRVAAITLAKRVAVEMNSELGDLVENLYCSYQCFF